MKKILFLLLLISGIAYGQTPSGFTKINSRYEYLAIGSDSGILVPRYAAVPSGVRGGMPNWAGQIAVDTTNSRLYFYSGGSWRYSTASTSGSGTVTSVGQAYGIINTPNPIVGVGTVMFDSATVFPQLLNTLALTTKGVETSTYSSSTRTFNIPKDQRVGLYLNLGKTYTRGKPLVFGSVLLGLGNSFITGAFSGGTPFMTQLGTYYGKTVYTPGINGSELNWLVNSSYAFGTFGNDTTTFVDISTGPAFGMITAGMPYSGSFYLSDNPNNPQMAKSKNYVYETYKAFIANHYLDNDWYSVSSLVDANYRDAVTADSLGSKSTPGVIGLGAFTFTKPAGKTSLVIGTYGADSTRVRQGTVTVTVAGVTVYSKYLNGHNNAEQGLSTPIKRGLNYEVILAQNLPDSAQTVVVTCSGDSTRFDYIGYLKPKEKAVRPLYINNMGHKLNQGLWTIPDNYTDTANQMLQNAVNDFIDYPVYIQNTNNWYRYPDMTQDGAHYNAQGNDSVAKGYIANLIPQSFVPINNAAWTQSGTSANYLSGSVGIGTSTPTYTLQVSGDSFLNDIVGSFTSYSTAVGDIGATIGAIDAAKNNRTTTITAAPSGGASISVTNGTADSSNIIEATIAQINIKPDRGALFIDTLNAFEDTTNWKPVVHRVSTGQVKRATYWPGGGGGGNVTKVGTPVNNQIGVWTGDGTIEGDADLTFDGTALTVGASVTAGTFVDAATYRVNGSQFCSSSGTVIDFAQAGGFTILNVPPILRYGGTSSSFPAWNGTTGGNMTLQDGAAGSAVKLIVGTTNAIVGVTTNNNATAGHIGEEITSTTSTYTNYTTTATYQAADSITLTAGDWDISCFYTYSSNSATITAASNAIFVVSTTTASAAGATEGLNISYVPQAALLGTSKFSDAITPFRASLSGSTKYYLNTQATFTIGNPQYVCTIRARRIR